MLLFKNVLWTVAIFFLACHVSEAAKEKRLPSPFDLSYGKQQFGKMLDDRPKMKTWILRSKFMDQWAVEQFAGNERQGLIAWDKGQLTNSSSEYVAESANNNGKAFIRVRGNCKADSSELLWAAFVFECFNIQNSKKHAAVKKAAFEGQLRREQYIEGKTRVEFDTMHKTAQFFSSHVAPYAKRRKMIVHPELWYADQNSTYEDWLRKYNNPNYYPFNSHGAYYDEYIKSIYRAKNGIR